MCGWLSPFQHLHNNYYEPSKADDGCAAVRRNPSSAAAFAPWLLTPFFHYAPALSLGIMMTLLFRLRSYRSRILLSFTYRAYCLRLLDGTVAR